MSNISFAQLCHDVVSVVAKEFGRLVYDATMRKLDPKWPDGMGPNTRVADAFRKVNIMPTCPEFLMPSANDDF